MKPAWPLLLLYLLALPALGEVSLSIEGGDAAIEENVRAHLDLLGEDCDAPEWRVRRLFVAVDKDVLDALRALGYYHPQVNKQFTSGEECWQATVTIVPGPRTTVRSRSVVVFGEAADDPQLPSLIETLPLAEGAPLNHAQYEDIKSRLRSFAAERGYLDFAFTRQQLRVYPEANAAEIDIQAQSGKRYRFGELRFGPHPLSDELVHKLTEARSGDEYTSGKLTAIDRQLSDTGYFRRVEVRPRRDEAEDGVVPVDILFDPAPRHAWRAGVGYDTDTLWRLSLGYENRYLNEDGHRFDSELRLGPVEAGLKADYTLPGEDPLTETYSVGARLLREETTSTQSDSVSLIGRHVVKSGGWIQTRFVELLHERYEVGSEDSSATLVMPGIGLDRTHSDDLLRPNRGYRLSFEVRGAYEGLLSTATFVQLRAGAKGLYRFGSAGRLIGRVRAATTVGDSTFDLPASLRFFAGGDNSVRGYEYKSLGPVDDDGEVVGGRHLLVGSIEYEHPVVDDDWWLAAFVDAGNAFSTDEFDPKVGYGLGVRWYSPIGRVRLDLAFPDQPEDDDNWRIHFGLGTEL